MKLIIDIGNTVAKLAVFDKKNLIEVFYDSKQSLDRLSEIQEKYPIEKAAISSVVTISDQMEMQLQAMKVPLLRLTYQTPIPIKNLYRSPSTLGMDRLAAAIGANEVYPNRDILIIDAGTCITYEFIDNKNQYHGGNISPGLEMRLKALNTFTDKLPQVKSEGICPSFGYNTETAIRSGVKRGIELEIEGYIRDLNNKSPHLLVFLTGGNEFSFETSKICTIFADKYIVLKGLNRILDYNDK